MNNRPPQFAQLSQLASNTERHSIERLFDGDRADEPNELVEALAAFATMDDSLGRRDPKLLDDLAHLLADDQDLLSRAYIEKRRAAEIAIELFVSAGYLTKAATLARAYRKTTSKLLSIHGAPAAEPLAVTLSRELLWSLLVQEPKPLADSLEQLGAAVRDSRLSVEEARYLSVAHAIAEACHSVLFEPRPVFSARTLEGRAELLIALAVETEQARLLRTSHRIASTVMQICTAATSYIIGNGNASLSARMLQALYGEASDCAIPSLWPPQRAAISNGLLSAPYYVVSAPTSSGKTFLAELKIATFLDRNPDGLAIYIAPYNALANQIGDMLTRRFRTAGIPPAVVWTGTYEIDFRDLGSTVLLVTTPEKLDGIIRSTGEGSVAGAQVRDRAGLLIFDELHLIGSHNRGVTYELLVTRLKRLFPNAEALAMSAVSDNAPTIARWFAERQTAYTMDSWSPTRRRILVYKRDGNLTSLIGESQYAMEAWTNTGNTAAKVVRRLLNGAAGPTLVLCTQVRYAIAIAKKIADGIGPTDDVDSDLAAAAIEVRAELGEDSVLGKLIPLGIGYHYRGLADRARAIVEKLAKSRRLRCVCATTTLAEGVHLPFRSLVIPYFNFGGSDFVNRSLLRNIVGRAGRAESNLKATIVFLEPGAGMVQTHFYSELVNKFDSPTEVRSVLPSLLQKPETLDGFESVLRLESQLLGLVQDQTFLDDQPRGFARATFAAQDDLDAVENLFVTKTEELEKRNPPCIAHNSPYTLTAFGKATAISGISDASARVLLRELSEMHRTGQPWFSCEAWVERPIPDDLIANIASLILTPFEFFQNTTYAHERRMGVLNRARLWYSSRDKAWLESTRSDQFMMMGWIKGLGVEAIFASGRDAGLDAHPFDEDDAALGRAHLQEYLDETKDFALWMLSAAIRLSEEYCKGASILPQPIFRKAAVLFTNGVASDVALRLVGLRVPRTISSTIAPELFEIASTDDEVFVPAARTALKNLAQHTPSKRHEIEKILETSFA